MGHIKGLLKKLCITDFSNSLKQTKSNLTCMALMTLMDRLITSLENDEHVIGIFLDLSKAYDTSIHVMLLKSIMVLETMPLNGLKVIRAIANNM